VLVAVVVALLDGVVADTTVVVADSVTLSATGDAAGFACDDGEIKSATVISSATIFEERAAKKLMTPVR
jgi:hypothetical protein